MNKFVELELFFTTADIIKIPVNHIKHFQISDITKDISFWK